MRTLGFDGAKRRRGTRSVSAEHRAGGPPIPPSPPFDWGFRIADFGLPVQRPRKLAGEG